MTAPFYVEKDRGMDVWVLFMRHGEQVLQECGDFDTLGEAIDHAYKNWPWSL